MPQLTVPPQPSETEPHCRPAHIAVEGVQPHTFCETPPLHVSGAVQPPHATVWPQLFTALPHAFEAHVVARGSGAQPHWPDIPPPPHVSGLAQVPQSTF